MRFESNRRCVTPFFSDPREKDGDLLFPERFPEEMVLDLERTLGSHATAGQLQQRPAPRGGGILKGAWFKYYQALPEMEWRSIYADTAMKTDESNDYSVFQCWGRSTVGQAYLIDQIRGKWEAPELLAQARAFWFKHMQTQGAPLRQMRVEDKASGTGLIQTLRREGIPILALQRARDKVSRAHDTSPFVESGNVYLPETAPWLSSFIAEVEAFPNGKNDDQLDPMFDAVRDVQLAPSTLDNVVNFRPPPRAALGSQRRY
jgi:predicted phage terminase large subunit-like protein